MVADPAPSSLLTSWGTLLHFDEAAGEARHAGLAAAPGNLFAVPAGSGRVRLDHASNGETRPLTVVGDRIVHTPSGKEPRLFDAVPLADGRVALRAEGDHLCAEPDGLARVNRPSIDEWETLAFLRGPDLATLRTLAGGAWYSASNRAVIQSGQIVPGIGFTIPIGAITPSLDDVLAASWAEAADTTRLGIVHDTWHVETLRAFRPLVLFSAFGPPATRDALAEALQALATPALYRGAVAVLTDASTATIEALAVPGLGPLLVRGVDLASPSLWPIGWCALPSLREFASYQPILCLGAHVMHEGPLAPVLEAALLSDRLLLAGADSSPLSAIALPSFAAMETAFSLIRHEGASAPSAAVAETLARSALEAVGAARLDASGHEAAFLDFRDFEAGGLPALAAMRRHRAQGRE